MTKIENIIKSCRSIFLKLIRIDNTNYACRVLKLLINPKDQKYYWESIIRDVIEINALYLLYLLSQQLLSNYLINSSNTAIEIKILSVSFTN